MSDDAPDAGMPAAPEVVSLLEPEAVLAALAHPLRHRLVCTLAGRGAASVNVLASRLGEAPDAISKHLSVLRKARLVRAVAAPGEDGRKQFYETSALFRSHDAAGKLVLDFGVVLLRVEPTGR